MAMRGTKRKAGLQLLLEESDDPRVKNNTKRNKLSHTDNDLSRLDEYDRDEGREGSRNFQQWAEIFESNTKGEAMKSKTFMKNFGERVRKQKDRLGLYIQEQETEFGSCSTKTKGQFAQMLEELDPMKHALSRTSGTNKESHFLFKDAQSVISDGYSLIKQFKGADEQLKNYKFDLPIGKWKQDMRDIKELFACGREHGEKLIERKLAPKSYPSPHPGERKTDEKNNLVSDLFKDSDKTTDGDSWGTIAADQVKNFAVIAGTIPAKILERSKHQTRRE